MWQTPKVLLGAHLLSSILCQNEGARQHE
jgi:hypothetical protein